MSPLRRRNMITRTKPRQAGSPATLDRWAVKLMRMHRHLMLAAKLNREMQGSLKRAERR